MQWQAIADAGAKDKNEKMQVSLNVSLLSK